MSTQTGYVSVNEKKVERTFLFSEIKDTLIVSVGEGMDWLKPLSSTWLLEKPREMDREMEKEPWDYHEIWCPFKFTVTEW